MRAIDRFKVKHGVDPTMMNLVKAMKVTKQTLSLRLRRARERGYIGRRPGEVAEHGQPSVRWFVTTAGRELL